ncbi:Oxysterol-binding protein-domain-containing protein [Lipomyces oligophaga]|uniref:Oxysterol-binding protein-domain-containing protein n=1 Tax=Lipomyces oligophaga TaxID=45792 RepID=UPI0034CD5A71
MSNLDSLPAKPSRTPTSMSTSSASSRRIRESLGISKGNLDDSIRTYRTLEALRKNDVDYIKQLINQQDSSRPSAAPSDVIHLLHLAVQVASLSTIQVILDMKCPLIDVNSTDSDGNTPLHLAAYLGREDVVSYLLSIPTINDTITNRAGQQPVELCRSLEIAQAMQVSRAQFVEKAASEMKSCFERNDTVKLEELLYNPRAAALLDINGQDPDTGSTVLHDAVRMKNIKMVQFILDHGGDPFRRDRKGKLPVEIAKDDTIKRMLKASTKNMNMVTSQSVNEPPKMRGYLKKWTNYTSGYKLRWFVLENGILSYYKHQDDTGTACRGSINMKIASLKLDSSEKHRFEIIGKGSVRYHLRANHPIEANRWVWALSQAIQYAKDQDRLTGHSPSKSQLVSADAQSIMTSIMTDDSKRLTAPHRVNTSTVGASSGSDRSAPFALPGVNYSEGHFNDGNVNENEDYDDDDDDDDDDDSSQERTLEEPPYKEINIRAHAMELELKALTDISTSIKEERGGLASQFPKIAEALDLYDASIQSLRNILEELAREGRERETYFRRRIERESELRRVWEDNMQKLAEENDQIGEHLHDAVEEKKLARKVLREVLGSSGTSSNENGYASPGESRTPTGIVKTSEALKLATVLSEEDDDEFFDAIESEQQEGTPSAKSVQLEQVETLVDKSASEHYEALTPAQKQIELAMIKTGAFRGYDDPPRFRFQTDEDTRPKVSLWATLKSLIGKDMTKMTLPVSFNEPTSLLQRVAEDMEYTDLIDEASLKDDSCLRMVYIAAFAASEYSSTINRIAKPFNPLLGETYEYSRPDKGYRFLIEQVSHHPPIGAAIAESPRWQYYGESAVKSKFNGRSFDINPLGKWFLHIRPSDGSAEDLYTWKKVTSSVVGIITGSPVVDNYGDMLIENHTTKDVCKLKFKQRGWLGSGAYEVYGTVYDAAGKPKYNVGGRWNDKIYGRKYQSNEVNDVLVQLSRDGDKPVANGKKSASGANGTETIAASLNSSPNPPFLVWQNHERPPRPFNLTPFAISLNALPEKLKPYLPPTDTRLRPDQRAMEDGRYDFAATEKSRLEDAQRARKKARDATGQVYEPRWFVKAKHNVTGDEYWCPNDEYWSTRETLGEKYDSTAVQPEWPGVTLIF